MNNEEFTEVCEKRDITRLKNLLRNYRDHIITNVQNKLCEDIALVIEKVDNSIELLKLGL